MALKLYYHPLWFFCHKALIAQYENGVPFDPVFEVRRWCFPKSCFPRVLRATASTPM